MEFNKQQPTFGLFTKFATKSYQGTGLGLFISKSIVEAHGGRMWAENNSVRSTDRKKKEATIYFTLPIKSRALIEEARALNEQQDLALICIKR